MRMKNILTASLFCLGFGLLFALVYLLTLAFFARRERKKGEVLHLANSYGYEYYRVLTPGTRFFLYFLLALSGMSLATGEALFFSLFSSYYTLSFAILFPLSLILFLLSNVIPLSSPKPHLFAAMGAFGLFGLAGILYSLVTVFPNITYYADSFSLPFLILVGAGGYLSFFSMFNPKLSDWAKMKRVEVDGATYYEKPKVNFLALGEWIGLFLSLFDALLFLLQAALLRTA